MISQKEPLIHLSNKFPEFSREDQWVLPRSLRRPINASSGFPHDKCPRIQLFFQGVLRDCNYSFLFDSLRILEDSPKKLPLGCIPTCVSNDWEWFGTLQRLCMAFPATRRQESLGADPYPLRTSSHSPKKFRKSCRKVVEEFTTDSTKNLHTSWQRLPKTPQNPRTTPPRCSQDVFEICSGRASRVADVSPTTQHCFPREYPPQEFRSQRQVLKKAILFATIFLKYSQISVSKNAQGKPLKIEPKSSRICEGFSCFSLQESSQNMLKVFTKFAEDVPRILPRIYILKKCTQGFPGWCAPFSGGKPREWSKIRPRPRMTFPTIPRSNRLRTPRPPRNWPE